MATRSLVTSAFSFLVAAFLVHPLVLAQEQPPEVENSKFQFSGVATAGAVNVRSGPGENYYPTLKLDKGATVRVVGHKFGWLKIVPPEGSFSVIAKTLVKKEDASNTGTVIGEPARVRAGSSLSTMKVTVQCKLKKGDVVTIVGEQDEYYMIKPPAEAYVYVSEKFVMPVKPVDGAAVAVGPATRSTGDQSVAQVGAVGTQSTTRPVQTTEVEVAVGPTNPTNPGNTENVAAPVPQVDEGAERAKAEAEYGRLEAAAKDMEGKPLDRQPLEELLVAYKKLNGNEYLPVSMRRMTDARVRSLTIKSEAKAELLATLKQQEETAARLNKLRTDREEMTAKGGVVEIFAALGTLQASTVQIGNGTLYRVTDPATGRTMCYVRSDEAKFVKFLGQLVGVKGELGTDPQLTLKVVMAVDVSAVDVARVGKSVTAQVMPPSFMTGKTPETVKTE